MALPRLSIGLPVYNGLPYLEQALRCVLDGELADFELIVCDNASTDRTRELVQDFASHDRRVRYVRNARNIGAARNFNKSFELARGEYFRWLASDDLHTPGAIARCVEALDRDPAVILAFPETRLIDAKGVVIQEYDDGDGWLAPSATARFRYSLTRWGLSNTMFGVIRTRVLRNTTLLGNYPASDLVMQSDLAIRGRFARVRGEYYYRRMHTGSTDNLDALALATFYNPDQESAFKTKILRLFQELGHVIRRAPVTTSERRLLWTALARSAFWQRDVLSRELGTLLWSALRRRASDIATLIGRPHPRSSFFKSQRQRG
jgi:glycosyltransferase involved in cell wall biosynthesis